MTRIVTSTYRYKPPPKRRNLAEITGPAIVTAADPKKLRRPATRKKAAPASDDGEPSGGRTTRLPEEAVGARQPRPSKSAIITARKPGKAIPDGLLPDTPEGHQRRGDAADAMFQEMKRKIASGE